MLWCCLSGAVDKILAESSEELVEVWPGQLYDDCPFIVGALIARDFDGARWREAWWRVMRDEQQDALALVVDACVQAERVIVVNATEEPGPTRLCGDLPPELFNSCHRRCLLR
jgi:hypothetical protein